MTSGTATKDIVTSEQGAGTTTGTVPNAPYLPQPTYFSPDFSIENSGNSDGSYQCSIHQAYSNGVLVTAAKPEQGGYGLGYSGWILSSFNPQSTLSWPTFDSCTVTVYGGCNNETNSCSTTNTSTSTSCLAGPLQLP